mmetsp:Transcript_41518/g.98913  ORF Transcript_41518/g.98913 Transcript_41518/m.98913 type:complete len:223 (-) Transcript_41518:325-993(-)
MPTLSELAWCTRFGFIEKRRVDRSDPRSSSLRISFECGRQSNRTPKARHRMKTSRMPVARKGRASRNRKWMKLARRGMASRKRKWMARRGRTSKKRKWMGPGLARRRRAWKPRMIRSPRRRAPLHAPVTRQLLSKSVVAGVAVEGEERRKAQAAEVAEVEAIREDEVKPQPEVMSPRSQPQRKPELPSQRHPKSKARTPTWTSPLKSERDCQSCCQSCHATA